MRNLNDIGKVGVNSYVGHGSVQEVMNSGVLHSKGVPKANLLNVGS